MKKRNKGFLSNELISHESEQFDYISELHHYLWKFVRCEIPGASGKLQDCLDKALKLAQQPDSRHEELRRFTLMILQGMLTNAKTDIWQTLIASSINGAKELQRQLDEIH